MYAILPLISLGLWIAGFSRRGFGWRESLLYSSIPWCLFVVYSTELLSPFHQVTRLGVSLAWLVCALLAASFFFFGAWTARRGSGFEGPGLSGPGFSGQEESSPNRTASKPVIDGWDWAALGFAAVLVAIVALTALVSAPNTWDAMEYHLPRVVEWMGNRGVQFYPTIDRQQLTMPAMSEYTMLHLDILSGSDRLVNLVQWFAYLGSIVGASLIVRELGGDGRTQLFASVLATTIPAAMLAASGAKNDNVLAYWTVVTIYLLLEWKKRQNWRLALGIGASIALTVFTKGTAFVFLPFLFLSCWMMYDGKARKRLAWSVPVFALILLSVCGPLWQRNYKMSGSVLGLPYFDGAGDVEGRKFANSHLGPAQSMAGLIRNLAINVAVPSKKINSLTTRVCDNLMWTMGVDPNDFGQIYRAQSGKAHPFDVQFHFLDEILVANQWNLLLFLTACVLYAANYRNMSRNLGWLALGLIGSFIMFTALIRWGPWNGRYQIPVFTLSVVFVAKVLTRILPRWATRSVMFALLLLSVPLATMNSMRPWIRIHGMVNTLLKLPHDNTYFLDEHQNLAGSFIAAANAPEVKSCQSVGLDANLLHFEYPMMALIQEGGRDHRFEYLAVNNPTVEYADANAPPPCVVVCLGCAESAEKLQIYGTHRKTELFGDIAVFSNNGNPVAAN